eukprot:c22148_g3_i1 orf=251-448(+)
MATHQDECFSSVSKLDNGSLQLHSTFCHYLVQYIYYKLHHFGICNALITCSQSANLVKFRMVAES